MWSLLVISGFKSISEKLIYFILPLWAFSLSNSTDIMSHIRLAEYLPFLFLGLVIGTIVDRIGSYKGMVIGTFGQIIIIFFILKFGEANIKLLYFLVFTLMGMTYLSNNSIISQSRYSFPKDRLIVFNKYNNMFSNLIESGGPILIGTILVIFSYTTTLYFSLASFILILILILVTQKSQQIPKQSDNSFTSDVIRGIKLLYAMKNLWFLSWWTAFANSIIVVSEIAIIYYSKSTLNFTDFQIGILFAFAGIWAITGSMFADKIEKKIGVIKVLIYSIFLIGLSYLFFIININFITIAILLFIESLLFSVYIVCVRTYRLVITPATDVGKISGVTGSIFKTLIPISLFIYGDYGSAVSLSTVFGLMAFLLILGSITLILSNVLDTNDNLSSNY